MDRVTTTIKAAMVKDHIVINQPFGIGDIIFIEPICRSIWEKSGHKPLLPVRDHLLDLQSYFESSIMVPMSKYPIDYDNTQMTDNYIPLRFANQIYRGYDKHDHHDLENMMLDKYRLLGLDIEKWRDITINFDDKKGQELLWEIAGEVEDYRLVNEHSGIGDIEIPVEGSRTIRMFNKPGYTVIDWFYVILHAEENHHVSTSTFFLMQAIANKFPYFNNSKKVIYPRPNIDIDGLRGISQLIPTFKFAI